MYMYKYWFQLWCAWRCIQAQPFLCAWMLLSCRWHCQAYCFFCGFVGGFEDRVPLVNDVRGKIWHWNAILKSNTIYFLFERGVVAAIARDIHWLFCDFAPVPVPMEGLPQWQWRGTRPCESVWFQDISSLLFEKRLSPIKGCTSSMIKIYHDIMI